MENMDDFKINDESPKIEIGRRKNSILYGKYEDQYL